VDIKHAHIKLVLLLIPIAIGLWCSIVDILQYQEGISSTNWQPAPGKILKFKFQLVRLDLDHMSYLPTTIEYSYHIKDQVYRGYRLTFPDQVLTHETPKALFKRLGPGRQITAYYDPQNISHSALERDVRKAAFVWLFVRDFCITFFTPAIWIFFYFRGLGKKKNNPLNFSV